ncbi:hypothetical protein ACIB24_17510 [Spongisporangium articulatum]|uniref:Uncharacterized protein n=1 Tax=Spongisporangium articulatum TaxID=3362603 RepID=A0ABW8AR57_9ACTN
MQTNRSIPHQLTRHAGQAPPRELDLASMPFRVAPQHRAEVEVLLREELVRPVLGDAVVAIDVPDDGLCRALTAGLFVPHSARERWVVAFRAAAWVLLGEAGAPGAELPGLPGSIDVIVGAGERRPADAGVTGRQVALGAGETTVVHGLRLTHAVRTAADLARDLPADQAQSWLVQLGRHCGVRPAQVLRQLSRMRYARGSARARPVVRAWEELENPW